VTLAAETAADSGDRFMQIGEVAERTGLTQRTLRYYESIGLLAPATRMEGGFRLYTEEDIRRLDQIVQLKRLLGFSLAEIRQIVEADETLRQIRHENKIEPDPFERRSRLERAQSILVSQLALVESRIVAMRELQASYERRIERIRGRLSGLDAQLTAGSTLAHASERPPEPAAVG
jgi:DNA-binding transcriptional MerR regulator